MNPLVEKHIESTVESMVGPKALKALKGVNKLAMKQGGQTAVQNYQLLGKKALAASGVALVSMQVAGLIIGGIASRKSQKRQIESAVARALEEERERERLSSLGIDEMPKDSFYLRHGKRACDIAVSVAALPIVGAVIAGCGIAIKREDGGPVFYNAPRIGKGGREFTMYKLRSMQVNAPDLVMEDGSTYNGEDDPRMTRVGAFMRRTSLDEIPQFVNVLKGDMSVVGPRPDLKRETELYEGDEALKLAVKPGITGYAAVYGRNSLPWHDRLALDVQYVHTLSFPLDVKVFFKTFGAVLKQEGVFVDDGSAR